MKTLKEAWGSEVKFTQSLPNALDNLNKITALAGLPTVIRAVNEYSIPGGSIDVVGFTTKGEAIVFEHQDLGGRADQTHVNKTVGYPHKLVDKGITVLGSVLMCESIDEHYVDQINRERKEYVRRKYNGHKNLHTVKSQWSDEGEYVPCLFNESEIIKVEDSRPLRYFKEFVNVYAREWNILGEQDDTGRAKGTITLWFRDISRGSHYIHKTSKEMKVGVHFDSPTEKEKELVEGYSGRHSQKRSTIEVVLPLDASSKSIWLTAEQIKQYIRENA